MKTLVIIVTYNGMRWIEKCLRSLEESIEKVDVFLIDNNSSDNTLSFVKNNFPSVIVRESKENLGFGRANNVGMKYALDNGYDFVLLLNQDAYVFPETISLLIAAADELGIYSPIHLNGDGIHFDNNFRSNTLIYSKDNNFFDDCYSGTLKKKYNVRSVNAACWFLPVDLLQKVGGFDPLFFHYGEDSNYYFRMKYHGYNYYIVPESKVIHDRGDYGNKSTYKKGQIYRNLLLASSDINQKALGLLSSIIKVWGQSFIKYPFIIAMKEFFVSNAKLMANIHQIKMNRKINKIGGPVWLS